MQFRTLKTLKLSRIGLGLAALGRPGYINLGHGEDLTQIDEASMQAQTQSVLDAAYALGIRYFDAARSYGKAEAFLGQWLNTKKPSDVVIASKWGYVYTADWQIQAKQHEVKEHTRERLVSQLAETRENLDNLHIYQIHSVTLESGVLDNTEVLEQLSELKTSGLLIGLSLSGIKQAETLEKALGITKNGQPLFDTVQATYNLLETSAEKMLKQAHYEGMAVIIKEALANGRLTERNTDVNFADKLLRLNHYAEHYGASLDAFALAFVLQQPWVDVVLSGAATATQLKSNLKALELATILDIEDFSEAPEKYWQQRSKLEWN
jgi:aryl-alcohol dehydrogenase-like predicted oxidoreductase